MKVQRLIFITFLLALAPGFSQNIFAQEKQRRSRSLQRTCSAIDSPTVLSRHVCKNLAVTPFLCPPGIPARSLFRNQGLNLSYASITRRPGARIVKRRDSIRIWRSRTGASARAWPNINAPMDPSERAESGQVINKAVALKAKRRRASAL